MLKLGDKVYHKASPEQAMYVARLWTKSSNFPAEVTVEYFSKEHEDYIKKRFAQANLVVWEEKE